MDVQKFARGINTLRALDPEIPMSAIVVLLETARHNEISHSDLAERVSLSRSSLGRALAYLGDRHWNRVGKKGGLGLVESIFDPIDLRARIARLTPKGKTFIQHLKDTIS